MDTKTTYTTRIDHECGGIAAGPGGDLHVGLCDLLRRAVAGEVLPDGLVWDPTAGTISGESEDWGGVVYEGLHDDLDRLQTATGTITDRHGDNTDYSGLATWWKDGYGTVSVALGPYWRDLVEMIALIEEHEAEERYARAQAARQARWDNECDAADRAYEDMRDREMGL